LALLDTLICFFIIYCIQNAGAPNFEICNGWRNAWLFAFKGFDSASKFLDPVLLFGHMIVLGDCDCLFSFSKYKIHILTLVNDLPYRLLVK